MSLFEMTMARPPRTFRLSIIMLLVVIASCSPEKGDESGSSGSRFTYSSTYRPMAFADDHRKQELDLLESSIRKLFTDQAEQLMIPGLAYGMVVDDTLLLSGATGWINLEDSIPADPESCFRIASMTKSFTAMAILKLRDEGKLLLNEPVETYIPELAGQEYLTSDAPLINIENLLTMTAGFPEDNPWGDRQLDEPDRMLTDLISRGLSLSNPPSFEYEYSNTGFAMLGKIITVVSGMPYQEYIRKSILDPLGMTHTFWDYKEIPGEELAIGYRWEEDQWKREPILHDGSYGAMGGLFTTIGDFSRYVSFHLSAWPPRSGPDTGPVKRSTLREMQTGKFTRLYGGARDQDGQNCAVTIGYGYGLSVYEDCHGIRMVYHSGALPGYGSDYYFFPDYGIGIMAFANLTYTSPLPFTKFLKLIKDSTHIRPRALPVSDILLKRQQQVTELIRNWDPELEKEILAENFFLDESRESRMAEIGEMLEQAGAIESVGDLEPLNQLRGSFKLRAQNGNLEIFFTLTPEHDPLVQRLEVSFQPFGSR